MLCLSDSFVTRRGNDDSHEGVVSGTVLGEDWRIHIISRLSQSAEESGEWSSDQPIV